MGIEGMIGVLRSLWLVWLVVLFAGVVFWAYRPKNRDRFEKDADIPFRTND